MATVQWFVMPGTFFNPGGGSKFQKQGHNLGNQGQNIEVKGVPHWGL